jgi:hypothetical protein
MPAIQLVRRFPYVRSMIPRSNRIGRGGSTGEHSITCRGPALNRVRRADRRYERGSFRIAAQMPIVILVGIISVLNACSSSDAGSNTTPASFTETGAPTATASLLPPTEAEILSTVDLVMPFVRQYNYYASCDSGSPGLVDSCPITQRLRQRMSELRDIPASVLCRCNNVSATRDIVAVTPLPGGGTAVLSIFSGTTKIEMVLTRDEKGRILVDDTRCVGDPSTSVYVYSGPCVTSSPAAH